MGVYHSGVSLWLCVELLEFWLLKGREDRMEGGRQLIYFYTCWKQMNKAAGHNQSSVLPAVISLLICLGGVDCMDGWVDWMEPLIQEAIHQSAAHS